MNKTPNIIIAGGKTGGHLFPGIAVAQAVRRRSDNVVVRFVGTDAPFEQRTLVEYGFSHTAICARPIKGGSIIQKAGALCSLALAFFQAALILIKYRPGCVLGVGGFSSFAVISAAWVLRIPTAIQEQNAFPGLTNRLLSRICGTIFTAFKETRGLSRKPNVRHVGNPVRKEARTGSGNSKEVLPDTDPSKLTLLITGGSQGAASINRAVMDAMAQMKDAAGRFNLIHQTGTAQADEIKAHYQRTGLPATAAPFFDNLPLLIEKADLVVARSGAGTLFELCEKGVPAIFVPYPHAADDHQTFNARAVEKEGGAVVIDDKNLDGTTLLKTIETLTAQPDRLREMGNRMKRFALADADEIIADHILTTLGLKGSI